jgi:histidine ammonia-lyase
MTAVGLINYIEAEQLAHPIGGDCFIDVKRLLGIEDACDVDVHHALGYRQQSEIAERIHRMISGSQLITKQG